MRGFAGACGPPEPVGLEDRTGEAQPATRPDLAGGAGDVLPAVGSPPARPSAHGLGPCARPALSCTWKAHLCPFLLMPSLRLLRGRETLVSSRLSSSPSLFPSVFFCRIAVPRPLLLLGAVLRTRCELGRRPPPHSRPFPLGGFACVNRLTGEDSSRSLPPTQTLRFRACSSPACPAGHVFSHRRGRRRLREGL